MNETSSIREQALYPERGRKNGLASPSPAAEAVAVTESDDLLDERMLCALRSASEKKAAEIVVLDLREIASFTDYFIITSGTNVRQVQAIADAVVEQLKKLRVKAARVEGYQTGEWVLVDYGDFVVHVFEDKARRFYDLERLWREAKRVLLPTEPDERTLDSLKS